MADKKLKMVKHNETILQLKENLNKNGVYGYDLSVNNVTLFSLCLVDGEVIVKIDVDSFKEGYVLFDNGIESLTVIDSITEGSVG